MAIKVTAKRKVRPGKEAELDVLLIELRTKALARNGYLSGETLVLATDPTVHLVISTWSSVHHWQSWKNHADRQALIAKINKLLVSVSEPEIWLERGADKGLPPPPIEGQTAV